MTDATAVQAEPWTVGEVDRSLLLDDEQIMDFIIRGYHLIEPHQRPGLNEEIDAILSARTSNPGNAIYEEVPLLHEVYAHPIVRATLGSILGHDCTMNPHRHWHNRPPSPHSQGWHQDGGNQRHHQTRVVLAMYYPHDVTLDMGPTVVLPGSHFRNCPTDRMAAYGNIRSQVALAVKAGTIAVTHYDIWHGGSINRSSRTRHMLKFLFSRTTEPETPAWNHDPQTAPALAARKFSFDRSAPCGQSDHYKEIALRHEMFKHMLGSKTEYRRASSNHSDENTSRGKRMY